MIFYSSEREKEKKGEREEGKRGGRRKEEKDRATAGRLGDDKGRPRKMKPIGCHGTLDLCTGL